MVDVAASARHPTVVKGYARAPGDTPLDRTGNRPLAVGTGLKGALLLRFIS
jgi:hypothetical protein